MEIGICGDIGFVEAPQDEVAGSAAGLRAADRVDVFYIASERIGGGVIVGLGVAQEGREIADRSETEPGDVRILRYISEFVERRWPKRSGSTEIARRQLDACRREEGCLGCACRGVRPIRSRNHLRRVAVILAHGQHGLRLVEARGRVGERQVRRRRADVDDEFLGGRAGNRRTVLVLRHRQGDAEELAALRRGEVPADFDDRPSHVHQEAGAGRARRWRDSGVPSSGNGCAGSGYAAIERTQRAGTAAVGYVVDHPVGRIRQVGRPDDLEIRREAHRSVGVLRSVLNVDDDGIVRIVRIDLVGERTGDDLVGPYRPETGAAKGGLGVVYGDRRHPCVCGVRAAQETNTN